MFTREKANHTQGNATGARQSVKLANQNAALANESTISYSQNVV